MRQRSSKTAQKAPPPPFPEDVVLFCQRGENGELTDFHGSKIGVRCCQGRDPGPILQASIREAEDGEEPTHFGWHDFLNGRVCMVYRNLLQVEVCFPYGTAAEEERGRGRVVPLVVEEIPLREE